jgi:uncharacterized membrane protein YfcA
MPGFSRVAGRRSRRFAVCGRSRGGNHRKWRWRHVSGVLPGPPRRRDSSAAANIANLVAGVAIGPGSALSSRRELVETRTVLVRLLPITSLGTVVGAGLLLVTPAGYSPRVVPFLVAAGAMVLIIQPALMKLP